jgi:hypothetical protein
MGEAISAAGTAGEFVAYYRVSIDRQGRSGPGLDAQRTAVGHYLAGIGGQVVAEHVEIENGRRTDRPELQAALVACKAPRRCWSLPSSIGWRATCTSSPA